MSILALTSDTLIGTPAAGNLEYNGQFFGTDSNASRAQLQRIAAGTAVASTSGTNIDFTGIPAWVERITVMFNGVSTNGTSYPLIQLGISSGPETSGYSSNSSYFTTATAAPATSTAGFVINNIGTAAQLMSGHLVLTLLNPATYLWVASGTFIGTGTYTQTAITGGLKTLSGTLDRVRITTVSGTETFDAGSINILYEG